MYNIKNKNIIVIGGSTGMGLAVAQSAFELGANVTLTSRSLKKAKTAAKSIGENVNFGALDVNNESEVNTFFEGFVTIDHIYVAAGSTKIGAVMDGSLDDNMRFFNERLLGSLRIVRAAVSKVPFLGSFTFTGGISTDRPIAGAWVSGLGTASAEQLARVLVLEFSGIRFNAVSPGYTDTPMWDTILGDDKAAILAGLAEKIPVKKIATSQEVASAVLFLMSNESVNGEVIHIDGGNRLV